MGDINKALKEKFLCSAQFAQDIESIVKDDNLGYIDAIVAYCEKNAIDVESVPKLISNCLLYTSPSPRDLDLSRMPSSA